MDIEGESELKIRCECHLWRLTLANDVSGGRVRDTVQTVLLSLKIENQELLRKFGAGDEAGNSQLSAWEAEISILYLQHLQNAAEKMCVHALHAVHAVPDLRVAAGRLRDGVSFRFTKKR